MADLDHDVMFVEEAAALRPRLERCARVLCVRPDGDQRQADRAVDQALAKTYVLSPDGDRTVAAFRALLHQSRRLPRSPHVDGERVELRDVAPSDDPDLGEDLAALGPTSQAVVVLSLLGGLTAEEVRRVVGAPRARVDEEFRDALERLARTDPGRADPRVLSRQLAHLGHPADDAATARAGVGDLARGRRMERAGRVRQSVLTAVAAVAITLLVGLVVRGTGHGEVADISPTSSPTPSPSNVSDPWRSYRCDATSADCRTLRTARWRSRTADVIVQHLDPSRSYFSDMTFALRPDVDSESFWFGHDGALDLTVSRTGTGGTEVYLQIATDAKHADSCGQRIRRQCRAHQSMDGNTYLIGGDSTASGGVEVQFYADEGRIITVVARTTSQGKKLQITSTDLFDLVRDTRLRLPRR